MQTRRHAGTDAYPRHIGRLAPRVQTAVTHVRRVFVVFIMLASIFHHAEFHPCAEKWCKRGCLVVLSTSLHEQRTLLFPSTSLLLFPHD